MIRQNFLHTTLAYARQELSRFTAGGRWSSQLPRPTQRNLRWFFWDGVFAQASDVIVLNYSTLYLLALGATAAQIGLLSSMGNLLAALMLLPGAFIVERVGARKPVVLFSGGGITRLTILLLALLPLAVYQPGWAVALFIAIRMVGMGFGNLSLPAWTSLTADIIPQKWRGRYLGTRNLAMGVIGMVVTFGIGGLITRLGEPRGYQVAFAIAFLIGILATYSYSRIKEPPLVTKTQENPLKPRMWLAMLRENRNYRFFALQTAVFNISLSVAGPFLSVYLVQVLGATPANVGALAVVHSVTTLLSQRFFGKLADRWGAHRLALITGFFIPLVPVFWMFTRAPWHVGLVYIFAGFFWAGYNMANFNYLLLVTPTENRARYTALYQMFVVLSAALGAAIGSFIVFEWGYYASMAISGAGRFLAAVLFALLVHNVLTQDDAAVPEGTGTITD